MKLSAIGRGLAAALVLVSLSGGNTQAQFTPTLNVSAVGNVVTIEWTAITGAQGYELVAGNGPGLSNVAVIRTAWPASLPTRLVVTAPTGQYYLRIRGFLGQLNGPFSEERAVSVGLEQCLPGTKPTVTATPEGPYINLAWTHVPGASQYSIAWSRFSGGTELTEVVTTAAVRKFIGKPGTYYARVTAATACGATTSDEVAFTLDLTPVGPRTPTPPSGRIPLDDPILRQAQAITESSPLFDAGGCNFAWIDALVLKLRQIDTRFGYNCKRGNRFPDGSCVELSKDIVAFNWGDEPDEGTRQVYTFDVIFNHCNPDGSRAAPGWSNTQPPPYVGMSSWTGAGKY